MLLPALLAPQGLQGRRTANLLKLRPFASFARQDIIAALPDQVSAPRQYVLPDPIQMRAGILASSAQLELTIQLLGEHLSLLVRLVARAHTQPLLDKQSVRHVEWATPGLCHRALLVSCLSTRTRQYQRQLARSLVRDRANFGQRQHAQLA